MKHFFFLIVLLAVIVVTGPAVAGTEHNLSGYAWADTVGWMSFNCTNVANECDRSNYGVTINPTTGQFSGYAWADNVGWISFTRDATMGTPPGAPFSGSEIYSALWNKTTNDVTGWAKILVLGNRGWLQFRDASIDPTTGRLSGWLWNGNSDGTGIGWVQLASVTVAQSVVQSPPTSPEATAMNQTTLTSGTIIDTGKTTLAITEPIAALYPIFTWSPFTDPNGTNDAQRAYHIVIEMQNADGQWEFLYEQTVENSGSSFRYPSSAPALVYGRTYRWKVRVQDSAGLWSPFSAWTNFQTPTQALPSLPADIAPAENIGAGESVQFDGHATLPEGSSIIRWQWNFGDGATLEGQQQYDADGNPIGVNYITPTHQYATEGTYTATLTVTDNAGYVVQRQVSVTVQVLTELPIWQRIIPF